MEKIEFKYSVQKVQAEIDEQELRLKVGFQKFIIPFSEIEYYRIFEHKDYNTLAIRYFKKGKKKYSEVLAAKEDNALQAIVKALDQKISEKNLHRVEKNEALKMMETKNLPKLVALTVAVVTAIITPVLYWLSETYDLNISWKLLVILALFPPVSLYFYFFKYND